MVFGCMRYTWYDVMLPVAYVSPNDLWTMDFVHKSGCHAEAAPEAVESEPQGPGFSWKDVLKTVLRLNQAGKFSEGASRRHLQCRTK